MTAPEQSPAELFEAAQRLAVQRIREVYGIPPAAVGDLLNEAHWKTDPSTRVGHLVYLNRPLCPPLRELREWWPGHTARRRCQPCSVIEEEQLAAKEDAAVAEDDGPGIEEDQ